MKRLAHPVLAAVPDRSKYLCIRCSRTAVVRQRVRVSAMLLSRRIRNVVFRFGQRIFDLLVGLPLLVLASPISLVLLLGHNKLGLKVQAVSLVGHKGKPFEQLRLEFTEHASLVGRALDREVIRSLPILLGILRGSCSFVGPRALTLQEFSGLPVRDRRRLEVRPGLISLWQLRKKTSINFGTESSTDLEYIESQSVLGDLGILIRSLLASLYGAVDEEGTAARTQILGIDIDNLSMDEAVDRISSMLTAGPARQISFVNPHCANVAFKNSEYREILSQSELTLVDGIGMRIASRILGMNLRQNVNGTDLFPRLCAHLEKQSIRLFFLGGEPEIPEKVADWVQEHYPNLEIAGCRHGYFTPAEEETVIEAINRSGADLLLVAMGVPKQDIWIARHLPQMKVKVAMGVGGLFDFYSGKNRRAPLWLREIGLEWVYRIFQEPRRLWRRYVVGNFLFLWRVGRKALLPAS